MSSNEEKKSKSPQDLKRESDRARIIMVLRARIPDADSPGCFLCRLIVEDYDKHGTLTDYPNDSNGKGTFPRQGKADHVRLELASLDSRARGAV